jgi:hypothetical protein
MAKFKVLLERPVYEQTWVVVEADNEQDAQDKALSSYVPDAFDWEISDEPVGDASAVYAEEMQK